jgi:hypothetical protein
VNFEFSINAWAACGPGLNTPEQWQAWAQQPVSCVGAGLPCLLDLPEVAPMLRRRLGPLGRMVVQVAYSAHDASLGIPVVLGSRYGDTARSLELLTELAKNQALSPTAFGLSVHNAIGAMYAMARADRSNYVAVAAGAGTAAASLVEAAGLLADGAPQVLVINYDAPLPGILSALEPTPAALFAWAWRVAPAQKGQPLFGLCARANAAAASSVALPHGLDVLRFFLAADASLTHQMDGTTWTWSRRDAH